MKILVGMSGGVDSAYAAYKLLREGHTVAGAVLEMHDYTDTSAAREACDALDIPIYIINCRELFEERVVANFIDEYRQARTPNPCVICNSEVKFECLLDFALANGFDRIATGHYARIGACGTGEGERFYVETSRDSKKDQTYMLWRLSQRVLSHLILPLSDITKEEVALLNSELNLVPVSKKESQEICFIPDNDHAAFIESRVGKSPEGDFVDDDGNVVGRHKGIINYTVGQRKGHGVALGARAFISDIDPKSNRITLSLKTSERYRFTVSGIVFSGIEAPKSEEKMRLTVKHRYHSPRISAEVAFLPDGRAEVTLDEPARSLTPGQSAVFYLGEKLAFGGFID